MKTADFYYDLPESLIAQDPLPDRSSSRLMVLDRETGSISHERFPDILGHLRAGDVLVVNDTKVIPARLLGVRIGTGAKIEILLLRRLTGDEWECLVRPGRKCRPGTLVGFGIPDEDGIYPLTAEIRDVLEEGMRKVKFTYEGVFEEVLDALGEMPLPPYIHRKLKNRDRYNTVYAKYEGSAAAPTAGLHFTDRLLADIREMGVIIVSVTLHVGLGTFRPVKAEEITDHHMHSEFYTVSGETARAINEAKASGRRVICVGTTSCRTVESAVARKKGIGEEGEDGGADYIEAGSGWTNIFIYPGYKFRIMDGLITNFHLPESTLIMLVSAFAGREHVLTAYAEAVREGYRFFSFGDAMLIL